jgi:hypothetical protein
VDDVVLVLLFLGFSLQEERVLMLVQEPRHLNSIITMIKTSMPRETTDERKLVVMILTTQMMMTRTMDGDWK